MVGSVNKWRYSNAKEKEEKERINMARKKRSPVRTALDITKTGTSIMVGAGVMAGVGAVAPAGARIPTATLSSGLSVLSIAPIAMGAGGVMSSLRELERAGKRKRR